MYLLLFIISHHNSMIDSFIHPFSTGDFVQVKTKALEELTNANVCVNTAHNIDNVLAMQCGVVLKENVCGGSDVVNSTVKKMVEARGWEDGASMTTKCASRCLRL